MSECFIKLKLRTGGIQLQTVMNNDGATSRAQLESAISADLRELMSESDQIGRLFATAHDVRPTDFRALLHVMVAQDAGQPMTSGDLSHRMGLSGAAITYLVDRLIESGLLRRDSHPADRRKVILRYSDSGMDTARSFFSPLAAHAGSAFEGLADDDLAAAHRVFTGFIAAMRRFQVELGSRKV
jgi:DNA-binding MarR family transcriptional regulator